MTTFPDNLPRQCSALSAAQDEPLLGTASQVEVWFLLGYAGPMGAKAFAESTILPDVKSYLNEQLDAIPRSRLLLIKPQAGNGNNEETISFYVVLGADENPYYYAFAFDQYEDLLTLDLQALVAGELQDAGPGERAPFYVVCTNGKRDVCCARYGLPVFEALRAQPATKVWQGSHVSGHRFAANVLMFPHGIYYGRITPENAPDLLEAGQSGQLLLDNYRGRASYDPIVKVGEALLREETSVLDLDAFRYQEHLELEADLWRVRFGETAHGQVHDLIIRSVESDTKVFVSCRGEKQSPMVRYALDAHQVYGNDAGGLQ